MKKSNLLWMRWPKLRFLITVFLASSLLFSFQNIAVAAQPNDSCSTESSSESDEAAAGRQAFLDFFGPDGVNECLDLDNGQGDAPFTDPATMTSDQQAVLSTVWETVGGGRVNRKYLNGLVAFCYDEELAFPNGAVYRYAAADQASITGQAAAIAQRFGRSGVDNAQWWSECQVAIWAVRAGCRSYDSAVAFARSYCADRKITDPATVEDYAYIVGTLVTETSGASGTAYLYQADDPANQRILTYLAVWPNPAPSYPAPKYDHVSATKEHLANREHRITLDHKSAAITKEALAGAVFTVYEDDLAVGTITTDSQGVGFCQWQLTETVSVTVTKEYCSNYDKLDPETRKAITGYTNREDAYVAAQTEAQEEAKRQAEELADQPRTVTIKETTIPFGFSAILHDPQTVTLTGNDSATISAINTPWSALLFIHKVDATTGETIPADTIFTLYEWDENRYIVSPHYQIIRQDDGIYTVLSTYKEGEPSHLYYTQQNQGKFALAESQPPHGYVLEEEWFSFQITEDGQTIWGHNAQPDRYPICDDSKFANLAPTGTICITKTGDHLTDTVLPAFDSNDSAKNTPPKTPASTIFQYASLPVAGASFEIYAAEDILQPGGSHQIATYQEIPLYKDTLAATITTDSHGVACLEGLPLGIYRIREISSGQGDFLLDPTEAIVALLYEDPYAFVVLNDSTHYHNRRQQISIDLIKKNRTLLDVLSGFPQASAIQETLSSELLSIQRPLPGAVFGLYTAQDIYGYVWDEVSGAVILTPTPLVPADTLLETVTTNPDGQAFFQTDLPCGNYYVRELSVPTGYLPTDDTFVVDACYTGGQGEPVLSFSHTFFNDPICLIITKLDANSQRTLAGARLALYRSSENDDPKEDAWELIDQWTSETTPHLLWGLVPGQYRLTEEQAPPGYHQAEPVEFSLDEHTPLTTITLENTPIPPQEPHLPSSPGAPTGDNSPLESACQRLVGSVLLICSMAKTILYKKRH